MSFELFKNVYVLFPILDYSQLSTDYGFITLYNQSTINLMCTYKIVMNVHGHSNTNTRGLCTEHCHFSFGIYLETKPIANEMQGRVSTLPPQKSAYSRLSLYAAWLQRILVFKLAW